jgi:hypothetical protein
MGSDHDTYVRQLAMARWPREYLALHGWKAYDGIIPLLWEGERTNVHDIWTAMRYIHPKPSALMGAASVPQLWGASNLHLWQADQS